MENTRAACGWNGDNRLLVSDQLVEFEKYPVGVQDFKETY